MRTLVIAPHFPLPETVGSSMRTMNFVRYFQRLGEVDLLCTKEGDVARAGDGWFTRVHLLESPKHAPRQTVAIRVLEKLLRLKSWSTAHYTPEQERAVRRIVTLSIVNTSCLIR